MKISCDICGAKLLVPGALIFGPPDNEWKVRKLHVCIFCWPMVEMLLPNDYKTHLQNGTEHAQETLDPRDVEHYDATVDRPDNTEG